MRPAFATLLVAGTLAAIAALALSGDGYRLALAIALMSHLVLATAWGLFSGPTRHVSLATAAFFGIGAYTVAIAGEALPWPAVLAIAAAGGAILALVVGIATLRLSGIFFVVFTFGLSELIRQLVTWYEVNIHGSVGRFVFLDVTQAQIFWQLLALAVAVFAAGAWIARAPLGLALRAIGDDEPAARHAGVDATRAKLVTFCLAATAMSIAGAIMAPRWTYIDPAIAFSPMLSFQIVVMALLGGAGRLYGPLLGAVPLTLLFEVVTARFPNHFSILLGLFFMVVVYFLPGGIAGLIDRLAPKRPAMPAPPTTAPVRRPPDGADPLLVVEGLRRTFGGLVAVDGLSFAVPRGAILGLIGPNGSGKTTALDLISGMRKPNAGSIRLGTAELTRLPAHAIARLGVARTFQLVRALPTLTCAENVTLGIAGRARPRWGTAARAEAEALLARVGLAGRGDEPVDRLTYIDQKRLELARALALEPEVLLLDEWLAGLNPEEMAEGIALIRALNREGLTIVMVEHVMDAIRSLSTTCVVMNAGRKIAEGGPLTVLADPEVVRAYLGESDA